MQSTSVVIQTKVRMMNASPTSDPLIAGPRPARGRFVRGDDAPFLTRDVFPWASRRTLYEVRRTSSSPEAFEVFEMDSGQLEHLVEALDGIFSSPVLVPPELRVGRSLCEDLFSDDVHPLHNLYAHRDRAAAEAAARNERAAAAHDQEMGRRGAAKVATIYEAAAEAAAVEKS